MREIKEIHIHCSATKEGKAITADEIRKWHLARGWSDIGYHYIVGFQGIDANGKPKDTRTPRQKELIIKLIKQLKGMYPKAKIYGHRDLSPDKNKDGKITENEWLKSCPCFDAIEEYAEFHPLSIKKKDAK